MKKLISQFWVQVFGTLFASALIALIPWLSKTTKGLNIGEKLLSEAVSFTITIQWWMITAIPFVVFALIKLRKWPPMRRAWDWIRRKPPKPSESYSEIQRQTRLDDKSHWDEQYYQFTVLEPFQHFQAVVDADKTGSHLPAKVKEDVRDYYKTQHIADIDSNGYVGLYPKGAHFFMLFTRDKFYKQD